MAIKRVKFEDIKKQTGNTDKDALDKMTDAEIIENALKDPDMPVPTKEELAEFEKVGKRYPGACLLNNTHKRKLKHVG